jgi:hypothetical protein
MSDDWKLPPDALGEWPAGEPPDGFVDRVMVARAADRARLEAALREPGAPAPRPPRRPRRLALATLVTVAIAATIALFVFTRPGGPPPARLAGGVDALAGRRSLDVGGRATAVAEAGASLDWRVAADGHALVHQSHGNVFYRVEKGGAFVVSTPVGDVTVLGTCFRVEVDPMNPKLQSVVAAGAGAIVSAAVLVTVYEGKVRVSNAHGQVDVRPGEQAVAQDGLAPSRLPPPDGPVKIVMGGPGVPADLLAPPPADATREQLIARDAKQREQIALLDARLHKLESSVGGVPGKPRSPADNDPRGWGDKMFGFTPAEYGEMAKSCEARFDMPSFDLEAPQLGAKQAEKLGLADEELGAVNEMLKRENDRYLKELRALYLEATGDTQGVDVLQPMAMGMEIQHKSNGRDSSTARRRIDLERAGTLAPPADVSKMPVIDRYFRLVTSIGDRIEQELAKIVGPERARAMREKGMGGNRSIMNGCGDDDDDEDADKK